MGTGKLFKSNIFYFSGLLILVTGLPVSLFLMSLSQFVLAAAFFTEGSCGPKFKRFFRNKAAMLFAGIWLMHVTGLIWTTDLHEGLKDVRIKLPLLVLPVIISGSQPLTRKQFKWLLIIFISSVFVSSMISMSILGGIIKRNIYDIRDIFIFHISHIRFALFTCLGICSLIWMAFINNSGIKKSYQLLSVILILWFLIFLVIIESVTGIIILSIILLLFLLYKSIYSRNNKTRLTALAFFIILPAVSVFTVNKIIGDYYHRHAYAINTNDRTKSGNGYYFNLETPYYENGYPVWVYVCEDELRPEWNKISAVKYDSLDERHQLLKYTLVRFMASKGLRKDAEGLTHLDSSERRAIERGIANVNNQNISSMRSRCFQIMWEFDQFLRGDVNGHSVTQRFEFWKTAVAISKTNFLLGVGTGDMPAAYSGEYEKLHSSLDMEHRLRAHNQYLAILVAFGITGLIYFLFALFYPLIVQIKNPQFLFCCFFIIMIFSMISEDTLETQPGATFVAFFFSVFLSGFNKSREQI